MNDFAGQDFNKRFESLGDLAEGKFEEWSDCNFMRYGLDRPPLAIWKLAPRIRHTPDYLTSNYLVECQGFGRKQIVHMKFDKWESLQWWDRNARESRTHDTQELFRRNPSNGNRNKAQRNRNTIKCKVFHTLCSCRGCDLHGLRFERVV